MMENPSPAGSVWKTSATWSTSASPGRWASPEDDCAHDDGGANVVAGQASERFGGRLSSTALHATRLPDPSHHSGTTAESLMSDRQFADEKLHAEEESRSARKPIGARPMSHKDQGGR